MSSNTECKLTDIELWCASASVDKTGDNILAVTEPFDTNGQSAMKGPSPQPDEGDTSDYAIPFKNYTYARVEKSSKSTAFPPGYTYAEVKKKAKPSPGNDKTMETTTLQASADEGTNVTYTYARVEKSREKGEGSRHTATKAEHHSTNLTAQKVTVLTPDYTYAEVKKKAKNSSGTDKTVKTTTLQASTVEARGHETELAYLYATVNKQKPCMN